MENELVSRLVNHNYLKSGCYYTILKSIQASDGGAQPSINNVSKTLLWQENLKKWPPSPGSWFVESTVRRILIHQRKDWRHQKRTNSRTTWLRNIMNWCYSHSRRCHFFQMCWRRHDSYCAINMCTTAYWIVRMALSDWY